jgi:hypothetical protein
MFFCVQITLFLNQIRRYFAQFFANLNIDPWFIKFAPSCPRWSLCCRSSTTGRRSCGSRCCSRDRFDKTPFRPKTFRINFHPQIFDKFPSEQQKNERILDIIIESGYQRAFKTIILKFIFVNFGRNCFIKLAPVRGRPSQAVREGGGPTAVLLEQQVYLQGQIRPPVGPFHAGQSGAESEEPESGSPAPARSAPELVFAAAVRRPVSPGAYPTKS